MRGRKLTALLLAACLLAALPSCSVQLSAAPGPVSRGTEKEYGERVYTRPVLEPDRSWDEKHTLDTDWRPELQNGLELPVQGATGYTTVAMGLWETPLEPEPDPETEPSAETPGTQTGQQGTEGVQGQEGTASPDPSGGGETGGAPEEGAPAGGTAAPEEGQPAPGSSAGAAGESVQPDPEGTESVQPGAGGTETAAPSGEGGETPGTEEPEPDPFEGALAVLEPGTAFTILEEEEGWWRVSCQEGEGWVEHLYCMINLPDVIPSMIYDATNSYDSLYRSSGKEIPGVTGESLYPGKADNPRLGREEFMMPVLYSMALKLCQAQQAALAEGNTLVLYEGYRPHSTQQAVYRGLSALSADDPAVEAGLNTSPWSLGWFIAVGYSNHQRGYAVDISLAKVWETERRDCGAYPYLAVSEYSLYDMPTAMHELSRLAVTFTAPVNSHSPAAWRGARLSDTMNEPAQALQRYCTGAGLTPLASEWWHFNDLDTRERVLENQGVGGFSVSQCLSRTP